MEITEITKIKLLELRKNYEAANEKFNRRLARLSKWLEQDHVPSTMLSFEADLVIEASNEVKAAADELDKFGDEIHCAILTDLIKSDKTTPTEILYKRIFL